MPSGTIEHVRGAGGRSLRVYLAGTGAPKRPALVVLHELLGLNDDIVRIADRFAEEGYVVAALDLYAGRGAQPFCVMKTLRALGEGGGDVLDDIEATRVYLTSRDDVVADAIGVVGFCMGGGFAVLAAGRGAFQVAAPFYGDVPRNPARLPKLCPTVASFGGLDRTFGAGAERLRGHLERAGVAHDVVSYPDAGHSFMSHHPPAVQAIGRMLPMHAAYDETAAEASWGRVLAFFETHLGAVRRANA